MERVSGASAGILAALSSCPLLPVSEDPAKASCVPRGELALALGSARACSENLFCADSQLSATWRGRGGGGGLGGKFSAS